MPCGAFFMGGAMGMECEGAGLAGGGADCEQMLGRMAMLVAAELDRLEAKLAGEGPAPDGKQAVDLVGQMAKTLEKIDQMARAAREMREAADEAKKAGELTADERDELARRVAARIDEIIAARKPARRTRRIGGDAGAGA
jgi:hypothetical protein